MKFTIENNVERHVVKVTVTPEYAKALLDKRTPEQIRRFDMRAAKALLDLISRIGYVEGNDNWSVDINGNFSNGQHRAWVVVQLGITVVQHIAFNCPIDEFSRTDTHRTRNQAVQLSLRGLKNYKMVSPCLKACVEFAHNRFTGYNHGFISSRITSNELFQIHEGSEYLQKHLHSMVGAKQRELFKTLGGFYAAICSAVDEDLWNDFRGKIIGEIATSESDVEFLLRRNLDKYGKSKVKLPQKIQTALIFKAWNYRVLNVSPRKILHWDEQKEGFPVFQGCSPQRFAQIANIPVIQEYVRVE